MQIIVNELPIEDALERARQRFERADRRLAEALTGDRTTLPWTLLGVLALAGGALGLTGMLPISPEAGAVVPALLVLGGACVGYALPLWLRRRAETKRRTREWQHALELLRLREQQAEDDPALTVEVLDRVDARHSPVNPKWNQGTSSASRYVQ
jgi:hypothetical protein